MNDLCVLCDSTIDTDNDLDLLWGRDDSPVHKWCAADYHHDWEIN